MKNRNIRKRKRKIIIRRLAFLGGMLALFLGITGWYTFMVRHMDISPLGLPSMISNEMIVSAIDARDAYDVPASVTIAQIIQESSGSYNDGLSKLAYKYKNLFGVKGEGPKGSVSLETVEYDKEGNRETVYADFRVYKNYHQSIMDHGELLTTKIYTNKTQGINWGTDLETWVVAMGSVYATDPSYAENLINIIHKYQLDRFDHMSVMELEELVE